MRRYSGISCLLLSWVLPAPSYAQEAVPAADPAERAEGETTAPDEPAATTATTTDPTTTTTTTTPTPTTQVEGECPLPAAASIASALTRSDAGEEGADLDLAACWRVLAQPYPERVVLARALERGLPAEQATAARVRLEELGGPPPATTAPDASADSAAGAPADAMPADPSANDDSLAAYVLAGLAIGGLVAGTAMGLGALYEDSRSERELVDDSLAVELGIAAGVCAGVGIAAGIAALVMWPEGETGPTAGPGEVGLGWEVRF